LLHHSARPQQDVSKIVGPQIRISRYLTRSIDDSFNSLIDNLIIVTIRLEQALFIYQLGDMGPVLAG
jgi:hypothetical protein